MRQITATDLMNPNVLAVRDTMSLQQLATVLLENDVTGAPVKDRSGRLVGVVSMIDVARVVATNPSPAGRGGEVVVADVMTPGVFSISEDATVSEIASAMLDRHLHRVVVTRQDEPIGIISTSDLLGLLVDEEE